MGKHNKPVEGMRFTSADGVSLKVIAYVNYETVYISDDSGNIRRTRTSKINGGRITWLNSSGNVRHTATATTNLEAVLEAAKTAKPSRELKYVPPGYYVYIVSIKGEVVYVGMGHKDRWKHATSGTSNNLELNRAYFNKEAVITEIFAMNLSREEALSLETKLITRFSPRFNTYLQNGSPSQPYEVVNDVVGKQHNAHDQTTMTS